MPEVVNFKGDEIANIVGRVLDLYGKKSNDKRYIISVAGTPGSGKTTLASRIVEILNNDHSIKSIVISQDGFHLYRSQLLQFEDPKEAVRRRGAPFTFDSKGFLELVSKLNDPRYKDTTILAPSFDHELKDPVENDIKIEPDVKIILLEGNYVSLKDPNWTEISNYVDDTWRCTASLNLVHQRLVKRHLASGIAVNEEEAIARAGGSDFDNAVYIVEHSKETAVLIHT